MEDERRCSESTKDHSNRKIEKTIFQKIIDREIPSDIIYEDEEILCIKDKFPQAKVHLLLITKACIPSIHDLEEKDFPLLMKIFQKIKTLTKMFGIEEAYRIVINRGDLAGQTIFHLHVHVLGGEKLGSLR